jgi:glycosyltransferase involved in cell wall biosynthesis
MSFSMSEPYILWLGGIFTPSAVSQFLAVNPAANRWRIGFINGLNTNGVATQLVSHRTEQCWPKGQLFPGRKEEFSVDYSQHVVHFTNAPVVRFRHLPVAYTQCVKRVLKNYGKPAAVLNYNPYSWNLGACRYLSQKEGIKWINVTLDYDDPTLDNWATYKKDTLGADGHVFLSNWAYENCPLGARFHLDAGVDWINEPKLAASLPVGRKKIVLYSGKINSEYGGADILAETLAAISHEDIRLIVCGKGGHPELEKLSKIDSRVELKGFVSDQELDDLSREAAVFINPRPIECSDSRMIFPSKLLSYMSYLKPVVSTWTPGLSADYREFFDVVEEDSPLQLAKKVDAILDWDESRRLAYAQKVHRYLHTDKRWEKLVGGLVKWMREEVGVIL